MENGSCVVACDTHSSSQNTTAVGAECAHYFVNNIAMMMASMNEMVFQKAAGLRSSRGGFFYLETPDSDDAVQTEIRIILCNVCMDWMHCFSEYVIDPGWDFAIFIHYGVIF